MPTKEYKFVECFKSLMEGSCNYCKSRSWNKGNKVYAMKKPDGKWLACTDRKCYLEQGGKLTLFEKDPPKPSDSQSISDLKEENMKLRKEIKLLERMLLDTLKEDT
jgi:hypothetical protein